MNINGIAEPIDQLDYDYIGNQLKKVDDALGTHFENNGFKDHGIQFLIYPYCILLLHLYPSHII